MADKVEYKTVQEYLEAQPEKTRKALLELKACILRIVPTANERINYNIPANTLVDGGKRDQQIMIAGYKNHVGLYPLQSLWKSSILSLMNIKKAKGRFSFH